MGWSDSPHTHIIATTKKREKPRVSSDAQYQGHLYWNSRQSWNHISRLIYSFAWDFLGDLPHFPWSHCTLTSQLYSASLFMETLWGNVQKDWPCIKEFELYNKLKSTNWCLKPRTFMVAEEFVVSHVLCCPMLLFWCQWGNINQSGKTAVVPLYTDTSCDLACFLSLGLKNKIVH